MWVIAIIVIIIILFRVKVSLGFLLIRDTYNIIQYNYNIIFLFPSVLSL